MCEQKKKWQKAESDKLVKSVSQIWWKGMLIALVDIIQM